jgi:hypothetical protein
VSHDTEHSGERVIGKRLHLWKFHEARVSVGVTGTWGPTHED